MCLRIIRKLVRAQVWLNAGFLRTGFFLSLSARCCSQATPLVSVGSTLWMRHSLAADSVRPWVLATTARTASAQKEYSWDLTCGTVVWFWENWDPLCHLYPTVWSEGITEDTGWTRTLWNKILEKCLLYWSQCSLFHSCRLFRSLQLLSFLCVLGWEFQLR